MVEDVKERTRRMLEEARRKAIEHERMSRANAGKNIFPLRLRLMVALPLLALAFTLYGASYHYMKFKMRPIEEAQGDTNNSNILNSNSTPNEGLDKQSVRHDDEELLSDSDKNW